MKESDGVIRIYCMTFSIEIFSQLSDGLTMTLRESEVMHSFQVFHFLTFPGSLMFRDISHLQLYFVGMVYKKKGFRYSVFFQ